VLVALAVRWPPVAMSAFPDLLRRMVLMEPLRFEDVPPMPFHACAERKNGAVNLGSMSAEEAQRSADFVGPVGVYALNGHSRTTERTGFSCSLPLRSVIQPR